MEHRQHVARCRQSSEYRDAERRLRPQMNLADEVLRLRLQRGWTQAELAERVGTGQANISRIENALANPTVETLRQLSEAFGTELHVTLDFEPQQIEEYVANVWLNDGQFIASFQSTVVIEQPEAVVDSEVAWAE